MRVSKRNEREHHIKRCWRRLTNYYHTSDKRAGSIGTRGGTRYCSSSLRTLSKAHNCFFLLTSLRSHFVSPPPTLNMMLGLVSLRDPDATSSGASARYFDAHCDLQQF